MSKQVARRTSDRVIEQYGDNIGARIGCVIEFITDAQVAELLALLAQPNGGVTLNADGTFSALTVLAAPTVPLDPQIALDVQAVKDYLAAAAPTATQTVAALKALGRGRNAS